MKTIPQIIKQHISERSIEVGINALAKERSASPALSKFLGREKTSIVDANKAIWNYIKAHNLQDAQDKKIIHVDAKLGTIFDKKQLAFQDVTKGLSAHLEKAPAPKTAAKATPKDGKAPSAPRKRRTVGEIKEELEQMAEARASNDNLGERLRRVADRERRLRKRAQSEEGSTIVRQTKESPKSQPSKIPSEKKSTTTTSDSSKKAISKSVEPKESQSSRRKTAKKDEQ